MRAFVFPGQGIQKAGMGGPLFDAFPEMAESASEVLGYSIRTLCLHDPDQRLKSTEFAQPAIYVVNALDHLRRLQEDPAPPAFLAGFSLGEYNALLAAGVFDFLTGLRIVQRRAQLMAQADGGAMAAVVGLEAPALRDALARHGARAVTLANHNTFEQFVLSGDRAELVRLKPLLEDTPGVQMVTMLNTSGAFHSPHMDGAREAFAAFVHGLPLSAPRIPVIANATARPYGADGIADLMARQITSPVLWTDSIQYLRSQGVDVFAEAGGSGVLTRMIDRISQRPPVPGGLSEAPLLRTIQARCAALPDKDLLVYERDEAVERVSGARLARASAAVGHALIGRVPPQARVVLLFPQGFHYGLGLLSCWYANAVAVPVAITDPLQLAHKADLLRAVVAGSGARHVLTDRAFKGPVAALAAELDCEVLDIEDWRDAPVPDEAAPRPAAREDLAVLLYTSGSTAQPKGVVLDHATMRNSALSPLWAMDEHSRVVSWLPQFHAFGICLGLLAPLARGASSVVLRPEQFIADPIRWFEAMDRHRATHTGAPNFAFDYCCSQLGPERLAGLSLASLRSLACGGDMIQQEAYARFAAHFAAAGLRPDVLRPNYGLSEAGPLTLQTLDEPAQSITLDRASLQRGLVRPAASGKTLMGCGAWHASTRIAIVDSDSRLPCPPDRVGEIWVKSPVVARGYFNDPEQTDLTFNGTLADTGEGGFLRTGDLGFVDGTQLYIVGREKDVIVVNGKNHHCADIEATIRKRVAACRWACAAFAADRLAGEDVADDARARIVVVQEMGPLDASQTHAGIAEAIVACVSEAHQIRIDDLVFVPPGAIPVTGSRKVRRKACRQQYLDATLNVAWRLHREAGEAGEAPEADRPSDGAELAYWAARLQDDVFVPELGAVASRLAAGASLGHLGLDSIGYIRLARRIEEAFRTTFKPGLFLEHNTRDALARHLMARGEALQDAVYPRWRAYRDETVMRLLDACAREEIDVRQTLAMLKEPA
jgi:malonyl CoA-acyl carrier protein transacylase